MTDSTGKQTSLGEIAGLFLKLGAIGFGGPAAHIGMMEDEVVQRRNWMDRPAFLDLVGATNLIPGPNSTEMAIHIGYIRRGWPGLLLGGICFILPAALLTTILAWAYVTYGSLPAVAPIIYGIAPAVLVIILQAVFRLGKTALRNRSLAAIGLVVFGMALLGLNEILALIFGGLIGMFWLKYLQDRRSARLVPLWVPLIPFERFIHLLRSLDFQALQAEAGPTLLQLGIFFLKVGSVLYGSGYILVAYLQGDLVNRYGWLTQKQLLDAVAIGQFTPGPVLTTATFIGYVLLGPAGAAVATVAIFLPSFLFVLALNPLIPRIRQSQAASHFLDAINASAVGLMTAVLIRLAQQSLTGWQPWLIAAILGILAFRTRLSSAWLILFGAGLGWILLALT